MLYNLIQPSNSGLSCLVVGDFNGDGKLDLAVAYHYGPGVGAVAVLLGNGDGTFQSPIYDVLQVSSIYSISEPQSMIAADFNGDGKLDLAVCGWNGISPANGVVILYGGGDGTFGPPTVIDTLPAVSLAAVDLYGDGHLDLVIGYGKAVSQTSAVGLWSEGGLNHYALWSTPPDPLPTPGDIHVTVGDLNGDGRIDIAATSNLGTVFFEQAPAVAGLPTSGISFGAQLVGTASAAQTVQVQNSGSALLTFTSIQASTNFTESDNCKPSVAANAGCTINVTFNPSATGSLTGTVTLTDNASDSPETVQLSGTGVLPAPNVSPLGLTFNNQLVGTTGASQAVTVTNTGSLALSISSLSISSDWTQSNNCLPSVPASGSCTINVSFSPTASGARNGALTLTDTAVNSPQTVNLSGTGLVPIVSFSQPSLSFGNQNVGTASSSQQVTLSNTGTGMLTISSIATTVSSFSQTNNCGTTLAAGTGCTINVTFTPSSPVTVNASLTVTDSASGSPQSVSLTGTGLGPIVSFSQPSLSFGNQNVGTASSAQQVTLSNTGSAALTISSIATTVGSFSQTNNCGTALAAGANCAINVTFTPSSPGTVTASLTVTDNASDSPESVSLTGTGVAPIVSFSQTSLSFGNQNVGTPSSTQQVTLSNTGTAPLTISSIATTQSSFSQTNSCGTGLAAGASCPINVTFTPSSLGPVSASLTVTDNASGSPHTVTLSGTGVAPAVSLSSPSLSFSNQLVGAPSGPQTETVTNSGTANLTISTVAVGGMNVGDFAKSADTCTAATVTPNGTCTVSVTFTPSATGGRNASLNFTDNAANSPQTVSLGGTGTAPSVSLSTTSVSFNNQQVETTSAANAVTVSNNGTASLTFTSIAATGDFAVVGSGTTCITGAPVAASSNCVINVTFTPTASGSRSGSLTLTDNASSSPQIVSLSGTGTAPVVSLSAPLTFSPQLVGTTSNSQTVTLTNTGNGSLTFTAIAVTGPFAIAASGTTCSTSNPVGAAATCTVAVTFTPSTAGAASGSLSFSDNAPGSPQAVALSGTGQDFSFAPPSGSPTSATVAPGQPAGYTLSVGGEDGLSGTVAFTCTGAPSEATCAVSPNPATVGSSATNITVIVTTTAPSVSPPRSRPLPPVPPIGPGLPGLWMLALALVAMAWAIIRRNQPGVSRGQAALLPLAAGLLLTLALAACGGGGGGGGGGGTTPNPGTPAGTYPLTVTGTAGSGSSAVSHSVTLTLTVS